MWVPLISPPISHFIGLSKSVRILGVLGIPSMWQLVFDSCHRLIPTTTRTQKGAWWSWPILWILAMVKKQAWISCAYNKNVHSRVTLIELPLWTPALLCRDRSLYKYHQKGKLLLVSLLFMRRLGECPPPWGLIVIVGDFIRVGFSWVTPC